MLGFILLILFNDFLYRLACSLRLFIRVYLIVLSGSLLLLCLLLSTFHGNHHDSTEHNKHHEHVDHVVGTLVKSSEGYGLVLSQGVSLVVSEGTRNLKCVLGISLSCYYFAFFIIIYNNKNYALFLRIIEYSGRELFTFRSDELNSAVVCFLKYAFCEFTVKIKLN